jgi:flagellar hook-basal body complex protein FliE
MSLKLKGLNPIAPIEMPSPSDASAAASSGSGGISFKSMLGSAIQQVEGARADADQNVEKFLSGDGGDLHSVILGSQRAELEFQMFMQVRNKVVSAYQEVMRMQM